MPNSYRYTRGFTLVEISLVIAVLGLLVGTIVGARMFMRNQELNRVLIDARSYAVAFEQFKIKYNAVPGDMINATEIWGRADGLSPITNNCDFPYHTSAKSTGKPTCNGNGNRLIDSWPGASSTVYEHWRTWQHLYAAGFIDQPSSGIGQGLASCGSSLCNIPGYNVPTGSMSGTGYAFMSTFVGLGFFYGSLDSTVTNNIIAFGTMNPSTSVSLIAAYGALSADEGYNIDVKADDGKPGLGFIQTNVAATCTVGASAAFLTATWLTTGTRRDCTLLFLNGFAVKPQ